MEYDKLKPTESARFAEHLTQTQTRTRKNIYAQYVVVALISILVTLAIVTTILVVTNHKHNYKSNNVPSPPTRVNSTGLTHNPETPLSESLTRICQVTRYPDLCVNSLGEYMNKNYYIDEIGYGEKHGNIVHVSLSVTTERLKKALDYFMMEINGYDEVKDSFQWSAHDDCVELMEESVELLTRSASPLLQLSLSNYSTTNQRNIQVKKRF